MFGALFTIVGVIIGGIIFIQALTMLLRFLNGGYKRARPQQRPERQERVTPIKGSPFSVNEVFNDYPTLNKLNNAVIEKYQRISSNKELLNQYRTDLFGLLDVHKRLIDQWRENVGIPGNEMISVSTEILTKINVKLDAIIRDMYRDSVEKLQIENKVLDHLK